MINKQRLENLTQEVWKGAIKLRGKFQAKNYPSVILPMINDIIVVRSGAYTADSAIIPVEFDGAITGYDLVLRCNKNIFPKFIAFALLSKYVLDDQLLLLSSRAAQPHLNREQLGNSKIFFQIMTNKRILLNI